MADPARAFTLAVLSTFLLVLAPSTALACEEVDPLDVLPADSACPGWTRDGEPMTAYTLEELMILVDGQAFLYEQYGFVAAAFQNYAGLVQSEPVSVTLSAFNQGTAENAAALFHDPSSGSGTPVADWTGSGEARLDVLFGFATFQFWEECFFVTVLAMSGGEGAVDGVRCLAEDIVATIQAQTPADPPTWGGVKYEFVR